jgi:tetratricopeptide (TPR) repeat protein
MNHTSRFLTSAAAACISTLAIAAGGGGGGSGGQDDSSFFNSQSADPIIRTVRTAIASKNWVAAQTALKTALASNQDNADYHNLYAYVIRKGPSPDMNLVFQHYNEALRIDPKHRGALEYLGEAYLSVNNLAKAKEQLAGLNRLCLFGCEEYTDLKQAVAQYEAGRKISTGSN